MATIRAAGGVLLTERDGRQLIAVVHRPRYADWSLPKGKPDRDEHPVQAACREIVEETGYRPVVQRRLPGQRYPVPEGSKTVEWWTMRAAGGSFTPNSEVDEMRWIAPTEAAELLSYRIDKELLQTALSAPSPTAIVLLVRHARAGDRKSWPGDDRVRPLDSEGVEQADRLAEVLPLWAPVRFSAADRLRCTQTVAPVAELLGGNVETEQTLSEEAFWDDPAAAVERIRAIARSGAASVVCSQGGAIPSIVRRMGDTDGVELPDIAAKKGSTWALSFAGDRLISADYYPHFRA